ncbi:translesion DNA synthesis-associated protein ImuA [Robbsia sp. Bb-Pol-6]|uniref:Translesion DNA synthesis-associated protein ImuA n=1 Tax=Robbsia betulipollinis TaxID=2981849 RepID=A0ABT3ZSP1_9BURK|nr:translesion DNA synthesis-associated protein ImuA [Robbsia betulipollinis]MCY0389560.1 translesion DNA synthesis-associated protein ImuA [Robbsia betulipollinis]
MLSSVLRSPESIHPSLWRGTQLAQGRGPCVDTGDAAFSHELPGGGWPLGVLVELLIQQPGIGELRLLRPALEALGARPLILLEPPHMPNQTAFTHWGMPLDRLHLIRAPRGADALWAAEQILRAGSCGALLFWQDPIRHDALRRLHLAAQSSDTLFILFRPLSTLHHASPAPLRLALRPAQDSLHVEFVKRRGPARDLPLAVALGPSPLLLNRHAPVDRRPSTAPVPRSVPAHLVD